MQLIVDGQGTVRWVYDETIDLSVLGTLVIRRASQVEPDPEGRWHADLSPVGGPTLGPFALRSEALDAERTWLETHWLAPTAVPGAAMGQRLWNRDGTIVGTITGTSLCRLEGCGGTRLHVRWPDHRRTYPCTKGCRGRADGDLQKSAEEGARP